MLGGFVVFKPEIVGSQARKNLLEARPPQGGVLEALSFLCLKPGESYTSTGQSDRGHTNLHDPDV